MSSLELNLWALGITCALTWLLSFPTRDHSWVDRIWSIAPVLYAWIWASGSGFTDLRLNVIAILITAWGVRLTFNFARKGGYTLGGEDYRWEILRQKMKPWQFEIFNLVFIVVIQNVIIFMITTPMLALAETKAAFDWLDALLAVVFIALLVFETVADQQQWNFHQFKKAEAAAGRKVTPGFLDKGLFAICRHPNFFAEQAQWWVIFIFSVSRVGFNSFNWIGATVLTLLFMGSTRFTEQISASKYPEYKQYQKRVSAVIPWFSRQS